MPPDIHQLLEALTRLAVRILGDEESFPPSGATVGTGGEISFTKAQEAEGHEEPEAQIALLQSSFQQAALMGQIRACAFAVDVRVEDPRDQQETEAILVSAETEQGEAMDIFVPYSREPELELGHPFASERDSRIFVTGEPS